MYRTSILLLTAMLCSSVSADEVGDWNSIFERTMNENPNILGPSSFTMAQRIPNWQQVRPLRQASPPKQRGSNVKT